MLPLAIRDFSRSNKHEDSHKESSWFLAFPHWFPTFPSPWLPVFSPCFPRSHPDFSHSYPDSPRFHLHSLRSHHSPHSVHRFPIPAFTDSLKLPSVKFLLKSLTSNKLILVQKSKYLNSIRVLPFFLSFFCWNEINKKSSREGTRKIRSSRISLQLYQKRDFAAGVSLWILRNF